MANKSIDRRSLLATAGIAAITTLAGCGTDTTDETNTTNEAEDTDSTDESETDFNFAEGFSQDGIEVTTALGADSAMGSASSLQVDFMQDVSQSGQSQTTNASGRFSQETRMGLTTIERTTGGQTGTQTLYINGETLYIQRELPESDTEYQQDDYTWNSQRAYRLNLLQQYLRGVNLSVSEYTEQDGTQVAIYTTDSVDSFTDQSIFGNSSQNTTLEDGTAELVVDQDGYVHSVNFEFSLASNGQNSSATLSFDYSNFGTIDEIQEPEWVSNNNFTDLTAEPEVTVDFTKNNDDSVTVNISAIENADIAEIVIGRQQVVGSLESPGRIIVEPDTYTADDGTIESIYIFARREGQRPSQITAYDPSQETEQDAATDTPTETNTTSQQSYSSLPF